MTQATFHHPSDATLAAYAAGSLAHGLSLIVATHLSMCGTCRKAVAVAEAMGGTLLDLAPAAPVDAGLLERTLLRLSMADETPVVHRPTERPWHGLPGPLSALLPADPEQVRWWPAGPGIRVASLNGVEPGDAIRLLKIAPERAVPEHGHGGQELSMVLQGAYVDAAGRFGPGDVADLDQDARHQPEAVGDIDCICVIATDAPLEFSGIAPRLLQPLLGL